MWLLGQHCFFCVLGGFTALACSCYGDQSGCLVIVMQLLGLATWFLMYFQVVSGHCCTFLRMFGMVAYFLTPLMIVSKEVSYCKCRDRPFFSGYIIQKIIFI